ARCRGSHRMTDSDQLYAFVEIPKGSRNKYEYDADLGHLVLDRTLWTSVVYPADYGFIVDTIGRDGDPVDCLVLVAEPTFPGCVIPVEPIGVFEMTDEKGEDDKVLCVPYKDPKWSHMHDISDIRDSLLDEIGHFFDVYKDLEHGADTVVGGWHTRAYADEVIAEGRAAFAKAAVAVDEGAVREYRLPQLGHAVTADGLGLDDRRPPLAVAVEREDRADLAAHRAGGGMVGLVDHDHVRDLHDAGLERLNR